MNTETSRLIRVAPATVIIFSVLFSPILLTGVLLIFRGEQIRDALGLIACYVGAIYWVCSPTVELGEQRLIYRALFQRKAIEISEIGRVSMGVKPAPTVTMMRKGGGSPLSFIVKPFSKAGVVAMFRHIREKNPEVQMDGISQDMSAGDFESINKETISTRNLVRIALGVGGSALAAALAKAVFQT